MIIKQLIAQRLPSSSNDNNNDNDDDDADLYVMGPIGVIGGQPNFEALKKFITKIICTLP